MTLFETIGHSLKIFGPSHETIRHPWCLKLFTGLVIMDIQISLFWYSYRPLCYNIFIKKFVSRLTEHYDVITPLLRGAPRLGLALGPTHARAGPVWSDQFQFTERPLAACNRYCHHQHNLQSSSKIGKTLSTPYSSSKQD